MSRTPRIPQLRKHSTKNLAYITIPDSGKRMKYFGAWGSDRARQAYDRWVAEWLANGRQEPPSPDEEGVQVKEVIDAYWRHVQAYYIKNGRPTSEQDTIRQALRFLKWLYADLPVQDFRPKHLKAVRRAMIEHGLARRYINKQVVRLRGLFKWGVSSDLVPVSAWRALGTIAGLRAHQEGVKESEPVDPVPWGRVEATLPELSATVAAMVHIQYLGGMRPIEVCLVRARDIDRGGEPWIYRPYEHKTEHRGKSRDIFLGPQARAILEPLMAGDPERWTFRTHDRAMTQTENRYCTGSYRTAIRRACARAGIEHWCPLQIRHTRASEIRVAYGLEAAQVVLGHARADVTQVYAERDRALAMSVMMKIG